MGAGRRGHLGGARRLVATSPTRRCWRGWRSIAPSRPSSASTCRARSTAGADCVQDDPRRGLPRGLRHRAQLVHPVVRLRRARCLDPADPARRLPARRRPAGARHDRRDPARPHPRRLRRAVPARRRTTTSTGCPAAKACSCRARSGSSTRSLMADRGDEARALFEQLLGDPQRPRSALRGVRPGREAPARELPAGVHPRRSRQLGVQPLPSRRADAPAHGSAVEERLSLNLIRRSRTRFTSFAPRPATRESGSLRESGSTQVQRWPKWCARGRERVTSASLAAWRASGPSDSTSATSTFTLRS